MDNDNGGVLGHISAGLRWLEEFVVLISGWTLALGMMLALIDLLTAGGLFGAFPGLVFAWAISQAIGITGQIAGAAFGIAHMARLRRWFAMIGFVILTAALGYVEFLAASAFTLHEALGMNTQAALNYMGIDAVSWALQRAALVVALVILSSLLRRASQKKTLEEQKRELEEKIILAPLQAKARGATILGWRNTAVAAVKGTDDTGTPEDTTSAIAQTVVSETGEDTPSNVSQFKPRAVAGKKSPRQWTGQDLIKYLSRHYSITLSPDQATEFIRQVCLKTKGQEQRLEGIVGKPLWADVRSVKAEIVARYGQPGAREAAD